MKLILHIGTHKTGTTAVQQFLRDNREALASEGVHYASDGGLNANLVANSIALDDLASARDFFRRELSAAAVQQARTVVVSAENFYCMTLVGAVLSRREPGALGVHEPELVRRLQGLLPETVSDVRVVACFRRPDRFAESLYNQRVKYETYHETFEQYLRSVEPMFHYGEVMSAWVDVFGRSSCDVMTYESVSGDMRSAFLRDVLEVVDSGAFVVSPVRDNERISRDVLEFKRELNRTTALADQQRQYRIACLLERETDLASSEPKDYREFFPPDARAAFLAAWNGEVEALQRVFDLPPFPPIERQDGVWAPYPGLTDVRRGELRRRHAAISRRLRWQHLSPRKAVRRLGSAMGATRR